MSDLSLYSHMMISADINRASNRIHSGLMSLASAQAGAMREMTGKLDGRLSQIDDTLAMQGEALDRMNEAVAGVRSDLRTGFIEVANRLSDMDHRLEQIEKNTSNPEETLAYERYRRGLELLKKGHPREALETIEAAIENGSGPAFRHIPAFQIALGCLRIGDHPGADKSAVDYDAAHRAFRQAAIHLEGKQQAVAYCRAAAASFLDKDYERAIDTYLDALPLPHDRHFTHFEITKCYLELGHVQGARHHLKHAVDNDWRMFALTALDPVMIRHGDVAERILREYSDAVIEWMQGRLEALAHVVTGPTERNLRKICATVSAAVESVDNTPTHPDIVATSKPYLNIGRFLNSEEPFDTVQISRLLAKDITPIDIADIVSSPRTLDDLRSEVSRWERLTKELTDILSGKYPLYGLVSGLRIDFDTEKAARSADYDGVKKPGLIGRLRGQRTPLSIRELESVRGDVCTEVRYKMAEKVQALPPELLQRLTRTSEIIQKARRGLGVLQRIETNEMRFLKPSSYTQAPKPGGNPSPE